MAIRPPSRSSRSPLTSDLAPVFGPLAIIPPVDLEPSVPVVRHEELPKDRGNDSSETTTNTACGVGQFQCQSVPTLYFEW